MIRMNITTGVRNMAFFLLLNQMFQKTSNDLAEGVIHALLENAGQKHADVRTSTARQSWSQTLVSTFPQSGPSLPDKNTVTCSALFFFIKSHGDWEKLWPVDHGTFPSSKKWNKMSKKLKSNFSYKGQRAICVRTLTNPELQLSKPCTE